MAETRAERLMRLLQKGGFEHVGDGDKKGPSYIIDESPSGKPRLRVENRETGEVSGFVGDTLDDCLDQLEARLGA